MSEASAVHDAWGVGEAYEAYVGRWSGLVANEFLGWLDVAPQRRWLDVGCGTGTLAAAILEARSPATVVGIDRSPGFVAHARARLTDPRVEFQIGDAQALPVADAVFDVVVSGLVLNFMAEPARMVAEMARAGRSGSTIALYVWDYGGGMELLRAFWGAARAVDPAVESLDEAIRFPICAPAPLEALMRGGGLTRVAIRPVDVPTVFRDFDDFWSPFLGGQGPAPAYTMALPEERRIALRDRIRLELPVASDGSIHLAARAWAVRGMR